MLLEVREDWPEALRRTGRSIPQKHLPQFQQSVREDDPFQVQAMPERMMPDVFQGMREIDGLDFPVFRKCFRPDLGRPHREFHILAGIRRCELPVDRALYMDYFGSIHR